MRTRCPFCRFKINTQGSEKKYFKKGENQDIVCPKCKLTVTLTPQGIQIKPSDLKNICHGNLICSP